MANKKQNGTLIYFFLDNYNEYTINVDKAIGWLGKKRHVSMRFLDLDGTSCIVSKIKTINPNLSIGNPIWRIQCGDKGETIIFIKPNTKQTKIANLPIYLVETKSGIIKEHSPSKANFLLKAGSKIKAQMDERGCITTTAYISKFNFAENGVFDSFETVTGCRYWAV